MERPILVIMAAGMGSRYGGLKQMDPVGPQGQILMDYSVYDAIRAGFRKVVFVIKREMEADFKQLIGRRTEAFVQVAYCFQDLTNLPHGYALPKGREKPWGTAHAVLCAAQELDGPFAVINADDYYGPDAFLQIARYLMEHPDDERYSFAMVGYILKNTLTENGFVSRGVCTLSENEKLLRVQEYTHIEKRPHGAAYSQDGGKTFADINPESIVSMNMWGFTNGFIKEAQEGFGQFLNSALMQNPLKAEYFLPGVVSRLISEKKADVQVLKSADKWYGVTYKEDKAAVQQALIELHAQGVYPSEMLGL